jgi:hypothetical protein
MAKEQDMGATRTMRTSVTIGAVVAVMLAVSGAAQAATWDLFYQAALSDTGPTGGKVLRLSSPNSGADAYGYLRYEPATPFTLNDLTELSVDFNMVQGPFVGGSPRFDIGLDFNNDGIWNDHLIYANWGTQPWGGGTPPTGWTSTGNVMGSSLWGNVTFFDGNTQYTAAGLKAAFGTIKVMRVYVSLDSGWAGNTQILDIDNFKINSDVYHIRQVGPGQQYTTIQGAIDAANPGDTIIVAAGTYAESVIVNKSVTLRGSNAGIHPAVGKHPTETVGVRGPETILSGLSPVADNITVDGFKFLKAGTRIIDTYSDANSFHLTNCIVESTAVGATTGVTQIGGGSHTNMLLDFNLFMDKGDHTLYFGGGPYDGLTVAYNKFNVEGDSIFWAATPLVNGVIDANEFDGTIGGVPGTGFAEMNIGHGGNIIIRNNWFHDQQYTAFQIGIIGGSVTGNTFEGIYPYGSYGANAFELWGGQWGTAVSTDVTISCNTIHYNDIAEAEYPTHGIRLRAPETGLGIDGSTIHISDNLFVNGAVLANAFAIRHEGNPATAVDADGNWWGTTNATAIAGMMSGNVNYTPFLENAPLCCLDNVVYLDVTAESLYVKPSETVVVDLNVANLQQPVTALQAMLNFSSTYFKADATGPGAPLIAAGGGVWDQLIYNVWTTGGNLDVVVGVQLDLANPGVGTQVDATTGIITLTPTGAEGTTKLVFRPDANPDPGLTMSTYLSDTAANPVWPTKLDSVNIVIDGTSPVLDVASAKQAGQELIGTTTNAVVGLIDIVVTATDVLAGLAAVPAVTVTPNGGSAEAATFVNESPAGTFHYSWSVTAGTPNGVATISASVADKAGNASTDTATFNITKHEITGTVELEGLAPPVGGITRTVTFAATGGTTKTWTVPVTFAAGASTGVYSLSDVPTGTTNLSAKTAWNLRRNVAVSYTDDRAVVSFTGSNKLLGGDINGSNSVNILDYSLVKTNWFTHNSVADINGDGNVGMEDYAIMKANWFVVGDPQ